MSKVKSAICLTLIVLAIAVLCLVCFVPFPVASAVKEDGTKVPTKFFNPLINWAEKSADLGGYLYGGSDPEYVGGSFSAVLYPEGVISAKEYEDNLAAKEGDDRTEYIADHTPYAGGAIYLDREIVKDGEPTEEFKAQFEAQVKTLRDRFNGMHAENTVFEIRDGYTVRVSYPAAMDASVAAFLYFAYMGELTVSYGTSQDAASATQVLPETGKKGGPITDYIKSISSGTSGTTAYVKVDFTSKGLSIVSDASSGAADTAGYLFVKVGDQTLVNLSVNTQITDDLFISGSYSSDTAAIISSVCATAMKYGSEVRGMEMRDLHRETGNFAGFGTALSALEVFYIAFAVCFAAMAVFFFVRYRRLGFAHLLSYLAFLVLATVVLWAIGLSGALTVSAGTLAAFMVASVLLCVTDALSYEAVRKEYALGKTMASSVTAGYKKTFLRTLDLYLVLIAAGLLVYLIALAELRAFALAFTLFTALAGAASMLLNRFLWYITMPFAKDAGAFCHFKREEVEDDD